MTAIIASAADTTQPSNSGDWGEQNLPSGIAADDLLIAAFAIDANPVGGATPTGWTVLEAQFGTAGVTLRPYWRKATADANDACDMSTVGHNQQGVCRIFRITGAEDPDTTAPFAGSTRTGTSATPFVNACTPTGGSDDYLWLALNAHDHDRSFTSGPTNYQGDDGTISSGGSQGAQLSYGSRALTAASEDPDNFTYGASDGYASLLIAIYPAAVSDVLQSQIMM